MHEHVQVLAGFRNETDILCHKATRDLKRQWRGTNHAITPTFLPDGLTPPDRRVSAEWFNKRLVSRMSRIVRSGDLAVAWPGTPIETIRALKDMGAVVAIEFINTHCQYSYRILDAEHRKLGLTYKGKISTERIEKDDFRIEEADIIFCRTGSSRTRS